mmetsp:Transcript_16154/g.40676  ORF Transcript_16154/g.40676 Transcript_16154/m.40676 type:complete len:240 (-) Transcript_16154:288-1007(-)
MSADFSTVPLARTERRCTALIGSEGDMKPSAPTFCVVKVETERPPVRAPMRRCSATASSCEVPPSMKRRVRSGTRAISSSSSVARSSSTSAYTTPAVGSACVSSTPPPASGCVSIGISFTFRSRSASPTRGMVARSAAESSLSCAALSAAVAAITCAISSSVSFALTAARRASSSAVILSPSVASGSSTTVERWLFSTISWVRRFSKTFSPAARRRFSSSSGCSKRSASSGELSAADLP